MKTGMLNKITYPTGGSSLFDYEAHCYKDDLGILRMAGGLRIRSITDEDGNGGILYSHFRYGQNEDGVGSLFQKISHENFYSVSTDFYFQPSYITYDQYSEQYEWRVANGSVSHRRRTYSSNSMIDLMYQAGSSVRYPIVTEYQSKDAANDEVTGKTVYRYSIPSGPTIQKVPGEAVILDYKNQWTFGHDTLTQVFTSQGSGSGKTYSPLRLTSKKYTEKSYLADAISVAKTYRRNNVIPNENPAWGYHSNVMRYQYDIVPGYNTVTQVIDTLIEVTGRHIKKSELFYDDSLNVFKESTTLSDGSKEVTHRLFPYNYSGSTTFINNLRTARFLTFPIEQVTYKEVGSTRTILSGVLTEYKTGGRGLIDQVFSVETLSPVALASFRFSNLALGQLPSINSIVAYQRDTRVEAALPGWYQDGHQIRRHHP